MNDPQDSEELKKHHRVLLITNIILLTTAIALITYTEYVGSNSMLRIFSFISLLSFTIGLVILYLRRVKS
jgi:hypothetical protein